MSVLLGHMLASVFKEGINQNNFCFALTQPVTSKLLNMPNHYYNSSCRVFKGQIKPSRFSLRDLVFMMLSRMLA